MEISEEEARKIARLARLRLSPEELGRTRVQLRKILDSMGELAKVDTSAVAPTSNVIGLVNVMREDKAATCDCREQLLDLAPAREHTLFKVRKVIE